MTLPSDRARAAAFHAAHLPGGLATADREAILDALAELIAATRSEAAAAMRERCLKAVADERQRCRDAEIQLRGAEADWAYGGHVAATRLLDALRKLPLD